MEVSASGHRTRSWGAADAREAPCAGDWEKLAGHEKLTARGGGAWATATATATATASVSVMVLVRGDGGDDGALAVVASVAHACEDVNAEPA